MAETITIRPQPGKQELFLSSSADITIYGGSAGSAKTYGLLLEPLRHINNPRFGAVIFRRTYPEITKEGGMWDEASVMYSNVGASPNKQQMQFRFPSGAKVTFASMQYDEDKTAWRGAQIALLAFDQLETFTESQFFYMLSRNRSTSGVRPYIRATCNPEPGWLAEFIGWWIAEDGYADLSRAGKLRYFVRIGGEIVWADSAEELAQRYPDTPPKSVTFIPATIYDNKILLAKDPGYLANLMALPYVDRERLLGHPVRGGNWRVKPEAGKVFDRAWFKLVEAVPAGGLVVRRWDFASTEKELSKRDPDFTASCLMLVVEGRYYILDVTAAQMGPAEVDSTFEALTRQDAARFEAEGRAYMCRWEQEGGSAGKRETARMVAKFAGIDAEGRPSTGDKLTRARPLAAQAVVGNVYLLQGSWNEAFLAHMHNQPDLPHDDIMDAASGALDDLTSYGWLLA